MFRASSEMAVATSVASIAENPRRAANARPCWRAVTMSLSAVIGTTVPVACARAPLFIAATGSPRPGSLTGLVVQVREAFFEIERRRHTFQRQAELDHRKGDLGLNP